MGGGMKNKAAVIHWVDAYAQGVIKAEECVSKLKATADADYFSAGGDEALKSLLRELSVEGVISEADLHVISACLTDESDDATRIFPGIDQLATVIKPKVEEKTLIRSHVTSPSHRDQIDTRKQKALQVGDVLKGRFVLEEVIGSGGMSVVYRARDIRKEEANDAHPYVAMKVLGGDFKEHPDAFMVLQRESQKSQKIAHPNIVTVYDFDREDDTVYMTMECLDGQSLDQIINDNYRGMAFKDALPIINGMGHALSYAHKKNIIHSDFKPGNVFVTSEGVVKVLDFGIARVKTAVMDEHGSPKDYDPGVLGALTVAYASCEMLEGVPPDPCDDVYALACIVYQLLTGQHPFNRCPANQARDEGREPKRIPGLSSRRWAALKRGLAFERSARTPTISQFLQGMNPTRRTQGQALGLFFILTLMAVSGYFFFQAEQAKDALPVVVLTEEDKAKISDYLEAAELYRGLGQWVLPPGDSAFDLYQEVLAIDPGNKVALDGKSLIAEHFYQLASNKDCALEPVLCQGLVDTGLQVSPNHKGLLRLNRQL